jgi:hypothetical protein
VVTTASWAVRLIGPGLPGSSLSARCLASPIRTCIARSLIMRDRVVHDPVMGGRRRRCRTLCTPVMYGRTVCYRTSGDRGVSDTVVARRVAGTRVAGMIAV